MEPSLRIKLLKEVDFLKIGTDETGTYPLQFILETINSEDERIIAVDKIIPLFFELSYDKFGSHIVEKTLSKCKYSVIKEKLEVLIYDDVLKLACDANGIKILKFYAQTVYTNTDYNRLEKMVFENIGVLINSQYGNYLLQCIIENWDIKYSWKIINKYKTKLLQLVTQKYSSNVIEKLISTVGEVSAFKIIIIFLSNN